MWSWWNLCLCLSLLPTLRDSAGVAEPMHGIGKGGFCGLASLLHLAAMLAIGILIMMILGVSLIQHRQEKAVQVALHSKLK